MQATQGQHELEHHGMFYSFCSEQCRENFRNNPHLYLGVSKEKGKQLPKRRKFLLNKALSPKQSEKVKASLSALMGIFDVRIDGKVVKVSYDLLQTRATQIEQAISDAGVALGSGLGTRLKRGWVHYTEETELDNLAADDAACCNKPPSEG